MIRKAVNNTPYLFEMVLSESDPTAVAIMSSQLIVDDKIGKDGIKSVRSMDIIRSSVFPAYYKIE